MIDQISEVLFVSGAAQGGRGRPAIWARSFQPPTSWYTTKPTGTTRLTIKCFQCVPISAKTASLRKIQKNSPVRRPVCVENRYVPRLVRQAQWHVMLNGKASPGYVITKMEGKLAFPMPKSITSRRS